MVKSNKEKKKTFSIIMNDTDKEIVKRAAQTKRMCYTKFIAIAGLEKAKEIVDKIEKEKAKHEAIEKIIKEKGFADVEEFIKNKGESK